MVGDYKKSLQQSVDSSKAEYRQLGKCGLRISVPILGAMSYGDPSWLSWVLDEEKVRDCSSIIILSSRP